jgi:hypothetical protein
MCRNNARMAFWSIDAAFALVLAVAMFAIFSALMNAAAASAARGAEQASGELLSARFSSYAASMAESGEEVDLYGVLGRTGRRYASIRSGNAFDYAGEAEGGVYCTQRLVVRDGKMERLEACIG